MPFVSPVSERGRAAKLDTRQDRRLDGIDWDSGFAFWLVTLKCLKNEHGPSNELHPICQRGDVYFNWKDALPLPNIPPVRSCAPCQSYARGKKKKCLKQSNMTFPTRNEEDKSLTRDKMMCLEYQGFITSSLKLASVLILFFFYKKKKMLLNISRPGRYPDFNINLDSF